VVTACVAVGGLLVGCGSAHTIGVAQHGITVPVTDGTPASSQRLVAKAEKILRRADVMRTVLKGTGYVICREGPWRSGGERDVSLGAVFTLLLKHEIAIHRVVPVLIHDSTIFPPYQYVEERIDQSHIGALYVHVATSRGQVVGLAPEEVPPRCE
jgi:hypothetical protein